MLTYCNPLAIADVKSGRWLDTDQTKTDARLFKDYRSISDPSVIYHEGKWIMYPSYSVAYVSEDFVHWKHVDVGIPNLRYSPAVVEFQGKWYLNGHGCSELYCADNPLGPFKICGHITDCNGNRVKPLDGCFLSDENRLYFYWHTSVAEKNGMDIEVNTGTVGVEMNPNQPWCMLTKPVLINCFDPNKTWQRMGEYHQNERMGWIEGQWVKKIGTRYYLLYSGCGTEFGAYSNGIAISDEGPLSGFQPQKRHDPFTEKRHGIMRGAGHGCLVDGPGSTLWTFYTCVFCFNHMYERRIGMDPVGIDENGELYCPAVTETPQYAPGVLQSPEVNNDTSWLPLTFMQRPEVSSYVEGREAIYASDDSVLTWWQPAPDDTEPMITFRLGRLTCYTLHALRIIWRDINMDTLQGINPGPFQYVVEYTEDPKMKEWKILIDESNNQEDLCIDYKQFSAVQAYGVRLKIVGSPIGITPGLVSLTVFGNCVHLT